MKIKRLLIIILIVTLILSIPFIAMQFSNEVAWSVSDFIIMALLLLGTGLAVEFVLRSLASTKRRIIACLVIIGLFLLIWAELAVGIFGTPFAGS